MAVIDRDDLGSEAPRSSRSPVFDASVKRILVALCVSTFVEWAGATAVLPLLPLYLRDRGSSLGLVGVTMAAFFAASLLVQYPIGKLSDRIGRRKIQLAGLSVYAAGSMLFVLFGTPDLALICRSLQGCGAGVVSVVNAATIGEVVPESHRGRAYGVYYGANIVAMAIGPFFGGLAGVNSMRWVFLGAAGAALLAAVPLGLCMPRGRISRAASVSAIRQKLWRNRSVLGVVTAFLAVGIVVGVYETCWSLLLSIRGAKAWQIGVSWTLFALPFAVMSFPAGWLVDRLDRRYLVAIALAGSACFAMTYPFLHSVWLIIGLGSGEAVLVAIGTPAQASQLAQSVPGYELGRAQGAASSAQTAATAVAAALAGGLFGIHPWLPFVGASCLIFMAIGVLGVVWRGVPGRAGVSSIAG